MSSRPSRLPPACSRCRPTPDQAGFVRLAGRLRLEDGAELTWSAADGSRGRRWRAIAIKDGTITHAALIEVDRDGRPSRFELSTPAGMLVLHPAPSGREIHGNVVPAMGEGVRPLAFAWGPDHELEVAGRPLASVVAVHRRRSQVVVGSHVDIDVLSIAPELAVVAGRRRFERLSGTRWRVGAVELEVDADGLPVGGTRWALEVD